MDTIYSLLSDFTFQTVALGSLLLGGISGVLGSFAMLRGQSLLGDGVSHAALPGVVLAFLLTGSKNTEVLLLGAMLSGILAAVCMNGIVKNSRIRFDSALALVMSVFFGGGLVLLTYAQKIPDASQAGLSRFIYGQASALMQRDVWLMVICGGFMLIVVLLLWKELKLFLFDEVFARTIGYPTGRLNLLISFLLVLAIVIGLQTVGVILMSAMLITPAVAARQWTRQLWSMTMLAAIFGGISGVAGTIVSSMNVGMPTGPAIVICVSIIAIGSLLLAPGRGVVYQLYQRKRTAAQGGEC